MTQKNKKREDREERKKQKLMRLIDKSKAGQAAGSIEKPPEVLMHDYGDFTEEVSKFWGNVEFIWDEYRIFADYIEWDKKTNIVIAKGRVTMTSKESVVSGEKLKIDLREKTGELYDAYGQMQPTVRYTADEWKQTENDTYKFKDLQFTSCAQCVPRWIIICTKGKIKKKKYIKMQDVVIKIKKTPFLYLPYLSYPIGDRATGFLFPSPGNHYIGGTTLKNAFYWDIKSNIDLTLYLDYYSKAGWGLAEEFRYLFKNMEGNLKFYLLKYRMSEVENDGITRNVFLKNSQIDYYMNFKHVHNIRFLDSTKIVMDVDNQSDPAFLRLFDNNFDRSLSNRYHSSIFIKTALKNISLSVRARKNVTFYNIDGTEDSNILVYLPSVSFNVNQQKIWRIPGYFSLNSGFERVTRSGISYEEGEEHYEPDFTSQRINVIPRYTLSLFTLPWLSSTINLMSKISYYFQSKDPVEKKIVDKPLYLYYNMVNGNLKGPVFFKIFETKKSKIKHLIEPDITFRYSTQVDDELITRLARVDFSDRPPYSYIGFGLTTRLLKKNKEENSYPKDILSYTISQNYYFDPREANFYRKIDGEFPKFSELSNRLMLRFIEDFSVDLSLAYNHYIKKFQRFNVLVSFNKEDSIIKGSVAYTIYRNPYKENFFRNKTYLRGDLDLDIPGFPLKLKTGIDYDVTDNVFRYGSILTSFDYQCINFNAELRVYTRFSGELDYQYNFGISFGNIGLVRDFLTSQR
ncbi:MAG: LPS-assembly protein LptD [Candidatus Aminicenantes bacterium]|nr:LPS-assembly protein LptD [Candidatus Aminicenantes bacterium]